MSRSPDSLYELLPDIHRLRDAEQGYPLRALLRVINEQRNLIESDIGRTYRNWFIETCDDWAVPYLGELIGVEPPNEGGSRLSGTGRRFLVARREVANALRLRRRKGTLSALEDLARDVSGWPARAVEYFPLLLRAQHLNHLRLARGRSVDVRDGRALEAPGSPFDTNARTVDVRRISSHRTQGLHNIPGIGVFLWRLHSFPITCAPACCIEREDPRCYTFNALGHDTQLFVAPAGQAEDPELRLPVPITRQRFLRHCEALYGNPGSVAIYAPDWPTRGAPQPVPLEHIVVADLQDWTYRAKRQQILVDPQRGRMVFPSSQLPRRGVWVRYRYGFTAPMGGGEYSRHATLPARYSLYRVSKQRTGQAEGSPIDRALDLCHRNAPVAGAFETINRALEQWRSDQAALGPEPDSADATAHAEWARAAQALRAAVIEIHDSAVYTEPLAVELAAGESLQIRAASGWRPVLNLLDYRTEHPDSAGIMGRRGSRFTLEGIVVAGRGIRIIGPYEGDERAREDDLCDVRIRHCTLVPGWSLECDCEPRRPNEPSLELVNTAARVEIEHSIVGSIHVVADTVTSDPVPLAIRDSIVDATSRRRMAIGAADGPMAFAQLDLRRCTVIGEVRAHAIELAENCIFTSPMRVARRQIGCLRFCYVPADSRTPRRYHCQPDLVEAAASAADRPSERSRVEPVFDSRRYGNPRYCRLALQCAPEITRGADDESEMGVFHDVYQAMRLANAQARVDDFTPAGMEAGVLLAD